MANTKKKTKAKVKKHHFKPTKGNVAKILAVVGAVGAGAALFTKRDKVKQVVKKWIAKLKKTA